MLEFAHSAGSPPKHHRLLNQQEPNENQANQHNPGLGCGVESVPVNGPSGSHDHSLVGWPPSVSCSSGFQTKSLPVGRLSSQRSLLTLGPNPPDRHLPLKTEELDKENNNQADQNSFKRLYWHIYFPAPGSRSPSHELRIYTILSRLCQIEACTLCAALSPAAVALPAPEDNGLVYRLTRLPATIADRDLTNLRFCGTLAPT